MEAIKSGIGSYNGKLLRVNLTKGKLKIENIPYQILKCFIGARGLGVKYLYDEVEPTIKPLGEDNKLIFATGPLTGTTAPTGCRYEVISKSPLTGTITSANAGGYFGAMLKKAGLDAIIFEGRAKKPVLLWIKNDEVELRSVQELWGLSTHETTDRLKEETENKEISVACIGPAGENLVKFASIMNDKHRAAGRGGVGTVMGSKNLKAVAVHGTNKIPVVIPEKFKKLNKKILKKIKETTVTNVNLRKFGTAKILDSVNDYRLFGTRNFQLNFFNKAKKINAEQLKKTIFVKRNTCFGCPIACKRVTQVDGKAGEGPEFETIWAFGAQCGISDIKAIAKANYLCNELGLDSISMGNTIGCAMELSEKGMISEKVSFGDTEVIQKLVKEIAYREGLGDKLAEGSFSFATSAGHPDLSMSVKKLELPAYDPRTAQAQGLGYATSNRGACHVRAFVVKSDMVAGPQKTDNKTIKEKTKLVIQSQNKLAVVDSLGMCLFSTFVCDMDDYNELMKAATGISFKNSNELLKIGERIWNIERLFNNKAGFSENDDKLPKRFITEKVFDSLDYEHVYPENELLSYYYKKRGWGKNGVPKKSKLSELGIDE